MPKSYAELQQSLTFDEMMMFLDNRFQAIPDNRSGNALRYELVDVLKAAFAMFSLKSPSLLDFKQQSISEEKNLNNIYRIEGEIPSDSQMRRILDPIDDNLLRPIFTSIFEHIKRAGIVREYEYWKQHVIVSVDGVEHFNSTNVNCSNCTTKKHRDGKMSYHHSGVAAVMVHPEQTEVFPLDFEPVLNKDGSKKNDCERNADKRLFEALHKNYPDLKIILVADAICSNGPQIRQINQYGWKYILSVKPDSHESLEKQFAGRRATGQVRELRMTDPSGNNHYFAWTHNLCLCNEAIDVTVNYLLYEQTDKKGNLTRWTWVTNLPLSVPTVESVMRAGRSRWEIENETFNTLKNQGYHFEHNYGHGTNYLATVLALLMLLAFFVDQIQQRCCKLFRHLWGSLKSKSKLWAAMRNLFNVLVFKSMKDLNKCMAANYRLHLE